MDLIPAQYSRVLEEQYKSISFLLSDYGKRYYDLCCEKYLQVLPQSPVFSVPKNRETMYEALVESASANSIFWKSDLCDLVLNSFRDMENFTLEMEKMPSQDGFIYFEKEMVISEELDVAADGMSFFALKNIGLLICVYTRRFFDLYSNGVLVTEPSMTVAWRNHDPILLTEDEFISDKIEPGEEKIVLDQMKLLSAVLAFLCQKVLVVSDQRADRATRKRVSAHFPEERPVKVVLLRRAYHGPQEPRDGEDVEWSCRWIVRGHWRNQWYPRLKAHQSVWVAPYVKGPEDKPLKQPSKTIFAVVR